MTIYELKKKIYDKGVNIYQFENTFYRRSKVINKLPKEEQEKAYKYFLVRIEDGTIKNPYTYFQTLIKQTSHQYHAKQNQKKDNTISDFTRQVVFQMPSM